jgi:hypothetical protein
MTLMKRRLANVASSNFTRLIPFPGRSVAVRRPASMTVDETTPWQELGYWHIGRTQIMTGKYGVEEYWHNDQANSMRTNHLDITLQPSFVRPPVGRGPRQPNPVLGGSAESDRLALALQERDVPSHLKKWNASLFLERLAEPRRVRPRAVSPRSTPVVEEAPVEPGPPEPAPAQDWVGGMLGIGTGTEGVIPVDPVVVEEEDIGVLEDAVPLPVAPVPKKGIKKKAGGRAAVVEGSLLRADGTMETVSVSML